ncbi:hypothetical protein [Thalassoglobus sp.]|uniref:hypothetical protein n=1 Tax=Thalassoglobus sp. TaxID=2795869 RepID=UPI003AA7F3BD
MTVERGTKSFNDHFDRAQILTTTPGHNGWTVADTSSSGTPTYLTTADGLKLTLAATSEPEIVTAYQNDILSFKLADIQRVDMTLLVAGIDAATTLVFGVGSAQNDTADSVANHAWFRIQGSVSTSAVVAETDDGTNDNNDVATGAGLADVLKRLVIDLNDLRNVKFYIDGERVAEGTTFDMSNVASGAGVQPFIQLQKASGTGTPSVTIRKFKIDSTYSYGA